jgi:hypothetical protein
LQSFHIHATKVAEGPEEHPSAAHSCP